MKQWFLMILSVLLLLFFAACSAQTESSYTKTDVAYREENGSGLLYGDAMEAPSQSAGGNVSLIQNQKLVRTMRIQAQTQDMDPLLTQMETKIRQLGGYVESKNLRNGSAYSGYYRRTLNMTVRIPADKADEFVAQVSENSNIVSSTESIDDVTLQYVDTESRVKALETEQERLLALLVKALTCMYPVDDRGIPPFQASINRICARLIKSAGITSIPAFA